MRIPLVLAALASLLLAATQARADFVIGARIGDSVIVGGSDGISARINVGKKRHRYRHHHHHEKYERPRPALGNPGQLHSRIGLAKQRHQERSRHDHRHGPRYFLYPVRTRTEVEAEPSKPVKPTPRPTVPAKPAEAADKAPPNPAGHARLLLARGARHATEIAVGAVLPSGVPHVTLDPVRFGLPTPPPGQIYARVRGQVFLIDQTTRLVHDRIEPAS